MQFKTTITLVRNTFNDFGEMQAGIRSDILCMVIDRVKKLVEARKDENTRRTYLTIMVSNKGFGPYLDVINDDSVRFEYQAVLYEVNKITTINDTSGKVRFYEVELREV